MIKSWLFVIVASLLTCLLTPIGIGEPADEPETVAVRNGPGSLHALLWRPHGTGPFPAILLNHGSGRTREELERLGP
jgi:hypothetical protein